MDLAPVPILDHLSCGPLRIAEGLVEIPLLGPAQGPPVMLLAPAIEQGLAEVTEVDEAGRVGWLRVRNLGDLPLLLLPGEEVRGAKQDRVMNRAQLVFPGHEQVVPVSCVERGRWRRASRTMSSSRRTLPSSLRSKLARSVHHSLHAGFEGGDQRGTWDEVDSYLKRSRTSSSTSSISHALDQILAGQGAHAQLTPLDDQVGALYLRDRFLLGMELLGQPAAWSEAWLAVSRGYFADLRARRGVDDVQLPLTRERPLEALRLHLGEARWEVEPRGGGVDELRFEGAHLVGSALRVEGALVHAAVWPC